MARIRLLSRSPEERDRSGLFLVEGVRLAEEALAEKVPIREAVVSDRLLRDTRGRRLLDALGAAGAPIRRASDALLDTLHEARAHQGILLVVARRATGAADLIPSGGPEAKVLAALGVQDPGNMGALIRIADAAGGSGLLAAGGADPFGPKAVRATAGSIFRLPIVRVAGAAEAMALAASWKRRGVTLAGAVPRGGADPREIEPPAPLALFVGGEGGGLPGVVEESLDLRLSIPMSPRVESINVAAAAAVLLFTWAPARRTATRPSPPAARRTAPSRRRPAPPGRPRR